MTQDLRYAVRVLLQSKAWTAMVVLSLALGIGANAAIFSAINGVLLRKVFVEKPDDLVRLRWAGKNDAGTSFSDYGNANKVDGEDVRSTFSYPMYQQLRKDNQTMTDLFASAPMNNINIVAGGNAEIASAFITTGNYYNILSVKPVLGRLITPDDDRPDAPAVAVISHGYWVRRFGSDPGVVGKVVQANGVAVTIIGVLPLEFNGVQTVFNSAPDISFPLEMDPLLNGQAPPPGAPAPPRRLSQTTFWWLQVVGRLKAGVTPQQVLGNLGNVFQNTARANLDAYLGGLTPEQRASSGNRDRREIPHLLVSSAAHGVYDVDSTTIRGATILSVVVALVLLIVCANVANLLLSRAAARHKEISVRLSMGATRIRLMRQLLTESVLLALLGGVAGIAVAYWGRQFLPFGSQAPLDWRFFSFVLVVAFATGIAFGIAPAMRATSGSINDALKETSRSVVGARTILSKALLVVQVAISVVLLIGAGLFLRTLRNLRSVDVGFDPQNIVLFRVNPQLNRYDQARINALYQQMLERLKAVPGVRSATLSNVVLLSGSTNITDFVVQGRAYARGSSENNIYRAAVAPNFFEMMGMPVILGRAFTANDVTSAPRVGIINETAARKFFPNENPVGRRFGSDPETSSQFEVVGVIKDVKYNSVRDAAPPTLYVPYFQGRLGQASFEVRTAADPSSLVGAVREAVRQVDPNVPLMNVSTQMEQIDQRFQQERVFAQAYALFGGLALLVASVGLFGLMSYSVTRRTNEIGIRMALGAQRGDVVGMVMRESLILVFIGVAVGLAAAWGGGRLVTTLLFGLTPTDPSTILVAVFVMVAVSAFAGYLPARRASRVDPMVALHYE